MIKLSGIILFSGLAMGVSAEANTSLGKEVYIDGSPLDREKELSEDVRQDSASARKTPKEEVIEVKTKTSRGSLQQGNSIPVRVFSGAEKEIRSGVILPVDTKEEKLLQVRAGDILNIEILHSVIAFPDEKSPVVGVVKSGKLKGSKLFGRAILEKNSHRIFIEFERVSLNSSTYEIKAAAVTEGGQTGFTGEYHSREAEYFTGDFLSSFVAGYFDSQIPRSTNAFGQIQEDRTIDAGFKKGLATGAMSSAERFRDKMKKVPEFSELSGPVAARIVIYEGGQRL